MMPRVWKGGVVGHNTHYRCDSCCSNKRYTWNCVAIQAMDGSMNMETSLDERLKVIDCKPDDVRRFVRANPPQNRLTPVG